MLEEPSEDSCELQRVVANSAAASASICIRGLSWELLLGRGALCGSAFAATIFRNSRSDGG